MKQEREPFEKFYKFMEKFCEFLDKKNTTKFETNHENFHGYSIKLKVVKKGFED